MWHPIPTLLENLKQRFILKTLLILHIVLWLQSQAANIFDIIHTGRIKCRWVANIKSAQYTPHFSESLPTSYKRIPISESEYVRSTFTAFFSRLHRAENSSLLLGTKWLKLGEPNKTRHMTNLKKNCAIRIFERMCRILDVNLYHKNK